MTGLVDRLLAVQGPCSTPRSPRWSSSKTHCSSGSSCPGRPSPCSVGWPPASGLPPCPVMMVTVVAAAIVGDSVGYEVGRHLGPGCWRVGCCAAVGSGWTGPGSSSPAGAAQRCSWGGTRAWCGTSAVPAWPPSQSSAPPSGVPHRAQSPASRRVTNATVGSPIGSTAASDLHGTSFVPRDLARDESDHAALALTHVVAAKRKRVTKTQPQVHPCGES
jgi:hypothetical protein